MLLKNNIRLIGVTVIDEVKQSNIFLYQYTTFTSFRANDVNPTLLNNLALNLQMAFKQRIHNKFQHAAIVRFVTDPERS